MTSQTRGSSGRRVGYLIAAIVNVILLVLVNGWPGWEAVPFLTPDAEAVVPLVNLALLLGIVANVTYIGADPAWIKALGDAVTTAVSLAVTIRTLQVFPFDFGDTTVDWDPWVRLGLWFLAVVTGIALVVQIVKFLRTLGGASDSDL